MKALIDVKDYNCSNLPPWSSDAQMFCFRDIFRLLSFLNPEIVLKSGRCLASVHKWRSKFQTDQPPSSSFFGLLTPPRGPTRTNL